MKLNVKILKPSEVEELLPKLYRMWCQISHLPDEEDMDGISSESFELLEEYGFEDVYALKDYLLRTISSYVGSLLATFARHGIDGKRKVESIIRNILGNNVETNKFIQFVVERLYKARWLDKYYAMSDADPIKWEDSEELVQHNNDGLVINNVVYL